MIGGYVGGIGTVPYIESGTNAYVTVTEDADTLTSAAVLALKATLDKTEDADTLVAGAALNIVAAADVTEDADTLTALGIYPQSLGTLDVTEDAVTLPADHSPALPLLRSWTARKRMTRSPQPFRIQGSEAGLPRQGHQEHHETCLI